MCATVVTFRDLEKQWATLSKLEMPELAWKMVDEGKKYAWERWARWSGYIMKNHKTHHEIMSHERAKRRHESHQECAGERCRLVMMTIISLHFKVVGEWIWLVGHLGSSPHSKIIGWFRKYMKEYLGKSLQKCHFWEEKSLRLPQSIKVYALLPSALHAFFFQIDLFSPNVWRGR